MHVAFIPYGVRPAVERFLRELESLKHNFPIWNEKTGQKGKQLLSGGVRVMPFGIYEYVFPKEDLDVILTNLRFDKPIPYGMGAKAALLRKVLGFKKCPKNFDNSKKYPIIDDDVSIIPIGIREDRVMTEEEGHPNAGWSHEAI